MNEFFLKVVGHRPATHDFLVTPLDTTSKEVQNFPLSNKQKEQFGITVLKTNGTKRWK